MAGEISSNAPLTLDCPALELPELTPYQKSLKKMVPGAEHEYTVRLELRGRNISFDPKEGRDMYVAIFIAGGSATRKLYQTERVPHDLNPVWEPFILRHDAMGGGRKSDTWFELRVMDSDPFLKDAEIGKAVVTLDELEEKTELTLKDAEYQEEEENPGRGQLLVVACEVEKNRPLRCEFRV
jgi:C2 domain